MEHKGIWSMIDYSDYERSFFCYDGLSCNKVGLVQNGVYYMVKFPGNLHHLAKVDLDHANDMISEYIASRVVSLYMMAHVVDLGWYHGKQCVACKDFVGDSGRLIEYTKLKTTLSEPIIDKNGNVSNGLSPEIDDVDYVLNHNRTAQQVKGVHESFWRMFILDALNGNTDRNNGNWGLLLKNGTISFAPVYDNGNALNSKWSDEKMETSIQNAEDMRTIAFKGCVCFFKHDDRKINPFQYIEANGAPYIKNELSKLDFSEVMYQKVCDIVEDTETISDVRKCFYKELYRLRFEELRRIQVAQNEFIAHA